MMKQFQSQKGYSLIELIIYIAIFAMLSVVLTRSLVTIIRTYASAQSYRTLQTNGELVMERLSRELRDATTISSSTYNTSPGAIALSGIDASNNVHTASFDVSGGAIRLDGNNLTTTDVTVTSFILRRMTTTLGSLVKVEITLTTNRGNVATTSFYSSFTLRGR